VAFVGVPGRGVDSQPAQQADATDAEHPLLAETHLCASRVELVRERLVSWLIALEIGVQEVQRDGSQPHEPGTHVYFAVGTGDRHQVRAAGFVQHRQQW
jgi:hypothetical protein